MDFQSWIDNIEGFAGIYAFDILPDDSYSEIRLMAVNQQNTGILTHNPNAPKFYPGIPYRTYWKDINFEDFVYRSASSGQPLYSYVNAHGVWLKGFYLPITEPGTVSAKLIAQRQPNECRTAYCLYVLTFTKQLDADAFSKRSAAASEAVMRISLKLHETQDFYQAMAQTVAEIQKLCNSKICAIYTLDNSNQKCEWLSEYGPLPEALRSFSNDMGCSPYEIAMAWERDIDGSDCLLLNDLKIIEERDPVWHENLVKFGVHNIVLYAIRYHQVLVGFIWVANYDADKTMQIKETLEMTTFLIAAVIANHQLVSRLEEKSSTDGLTQVSNRNSMNERIERLVSGAAERPSVMGVVFADLNGLKTVNDFEGHDAGDKLLTHAAALLKIVFGDYEIYRAGGDEFMIFCPGIAEEQLLELELQLRAMADNTNNVSFAIGTVYCTGDYDLKHSIQLADERMYQDKAEHYRMHPEKYQRSHNKQ